MMRKVFVIGISLFLCAFIYGNAEKESRDFQYIYNRLYKQNLHTEAIMELETFIKKYPNSKLYNSALNLLGVNYYAMKNYEGAEEAFLNLRNTSFKNDANYYLTLIYINQDEIKKAEKATQSISGNNPLREKADYFIADYHYKNENYDNAKQYYRKFMKKDSDFYVNANLRLGIIAYKQDEYIRAASYLEEYLSLVSAMKINTENLAVVNYILADINKELDDIKNAVKYYRVIENDYADTQYYEVSVFNLYKIYKNNKIEDKMLTYLDKLESTMYSEESNIMAGDFYYDNLNYVEAEKFYKKEIKGKRKDYVVYKLTMTFIKQDKYTQALAIVAELKDTKYNQEYYYYYTFLLHKEKQYKELVMKMQDVDKKELKKEYKTSVYSMVGDAAYYEKQYAIAKKYYSKLYLAQKDKKDLYKLTLACHHLNEDQKTVELFEEYVRLFPEDIEYKRELYNIAGNAYYELEKYDLSEKTFKAYLAYKDDKMIANNLIATLLKQEKYNETAKYLEKAEKTPENLFLKAEMYVKLKQYEKAIESYKAVLDKEEQEYLEKAYFGLIETFNILENYKSVIRYAEMYIRKNHEKYKYEILELKAFAYMKNKEYEKARWDFQALQAVDSKKDMALFMIAQVYYNEEKYEESKKNYEKLVLDFPDSKYRKKSLYWLINLNYNQQDYNAALNYIEFFMKSYSDDKEYMQDITYFLAKIYLDKNEIEKAAKEYEKLLQYTKDNNDKQKIMEAIMKIYFNQGEFKQARIWVERMPESSFKTLWDGIIDLREGISEEAVKNFEKVKDDKEVGDKANYYLGNHYFDTKEYEKARESYEKLLEGFSASEYRDNALFKTGLSYEQQGNYAQAIINYSRVKFLYEGSELYDTAVVKLSEMYEKNNEQQKAIENYIFFYKNIKESAFRSIVLERLLVYYINEEDIDTGRKYYKELKIVDAELAETYRKYFK